MTKSIDQLRRDAKALKTAYETRDAYARLRVNNYVPDHEDRRLKHADFLHVIARELSFASWPHLKLSAEVNGMDRAAKQQRLGVALKNGQDWVAQRLLAEDPDLAVGNIGLACCLYLVDEVKRLVAEDPSRATARAPLAPPLTILAQSRAIHMFPERKDAMLEIADFLLAHGADVNAGVPIYADDDHALPPLYFAIGHGNNMALGRWLLEHGANPNDDESLYHSTELGHHEGLKMLLEFGADPKGTNALLRAMDFHDVEAVKLLLDAGAEADEFDGRHIGGEAPWVVPALHQAARRGSPEEMIEVLLDAGADPQRVYEGMTPYAYAKVFGNQTLADILDRRGQATPLSEVEQKLADIADGKEPEGRFIDPETLPEACRNIIRMILHLPGTLPHIKRLVAAGVEYDRPDSEGLTPVQLAGWEGLPEVMAYFLDLKPDLTHVNNYGGNLMSTILHGSENCPQRAGRDHIECLRLALEHGLALSRRAIEMAGDEEIAAFLRDWAEAHPGQLVDGGPG